jgi:hypothetical protein
LTIAVPLLAGWTSSQIHDRIKLNNGKVISKGNPVSSNFLLTAGSKRIIQETHDSSKIIVPKLKRQKTLAKINKNSILATYDELCREKGIIKQELSTIVKGEPQFRPECPPRLHSLVINCKMKPSLDHQYRVMDLSLDNVIMFSLSRIMSNMTSQVKIYSIYPRSIDYMVT